MKKTIVLLLIISLFSVKPAEASYHFDSFKASPPLHILTSSKTRTAGLTPDIIKKIYNLPEGGGTGTIAIIGAYHDPNIEKDLAVFNNSFNLTPCTIKNGCFEEYSINTATKTADLGWSLETSLDVEWAHAIAPDAHILLIEATTPSGANLLKAIDYATSQKDVVAVSMSWGGQEFPEEITLDSHFKNTKAFFAASGDSGSGTNWPAVSPYVVAVGGTSLSLSKTNSLISESAWSGSGGGVSAYEREPAYQINYNIPKDKGMRSIPDVSYNADPKSGFAVYRNGKWYVLGGTSAGTPQWAAIQSLGLSALHENLYRDKSSIDTEKFFRDIKSGTNGNCTYYCKARAHYDYVTGLGSPLTVHF